MVTMDVTNNKQHVQQQQQQQQHHQCPFVSCTCVSMVTMDVPTTLTSTTTINIT
jgi:hypothetical protein